MPQRVSFFCLILFIAFTLLELFSHLAGFSTLHLLVKPLLMPALLGYFGAETYRKNIRRKELIFLALVFSFLGDTSLLLDRHHSLYFVVGLAMFLIAHLFYIVFFAKSTSSLFWHKLKIMIFVVFIYGAGLLWFLSPHLGDMRIAVWVYAFTIMLMLLLSYHLYLHFPSAIWVFSGAILFVLSDSLIAIDKFAFKVPQAQFLIMLTYIAAQWFIVNGVLKLQRQ